MIKKIKGVNDLSSGQGLRRIFIFGLILFFLNSCRPDNKIDRNRFQGIGEAAAGSNPKSPILIFLSL